MGFGFLLYGYLMLITAGNSHIDFFPDLLGYAFFYLALRKLTPYSTNFARAKTICYPLFAVGALTLCGQICTQFSLSPGLFSQILAYSELVKNLILLFFHNFLMRAIAELSSDVGLPKLVTRARVGLSLSSVFYLLALVLQSFEMLFSELVQKYAQIYSLAGMIYMLLYFAVFFYNLLLIFACYRQICYEGEESSEPPDNPIEKFFKMISKNRKDL